MTAAAPAPATPPLPAVAALRGALLGVAEGELRLRDAGYAAGSALHAAFAGRVHARTGADAATLPLSVFLDELAAFFHDEGWGTLTVVDVGSTVTFAAADWAEAAMEDGPAPYPACHFSTGLFAGFLAHVAGRPLAVLETRCRAAGDARCEFTAGSPDVMDRLWDGMMRGGRS